MFCSGGIGGEREILDGKSITRTTAFGDQIMRGVGGGGGGGRRRRQWSFCAPRRVLLGGWPK
jgi:hypothetical protein